LLHYYPRHVSNINMPIFRRKNCIHTASGIFALKIRCVLFALTTAPIENNGVNWCRSQSKQDTSNFQSEDTRCCVNTIFPPEDGHVNVRNMSRIIM